MKCYYVTPTSITSDRDNMVSPNAHLFNVKSKCPRSFPHNTAVGTHNSLDLVPLLHVRLQVVVKLKNNREKCAKSQDVGTQIT